MCAGRRSMGKSSTLARKFLEKDNAKRDSDARRYDSSDSSVYRPVCPSWCVIDCVRCRVVI